LGYKGFNVGANDRASGAYVFRPNGTDVYPVGDTVTATLISGTVVQEIQQTFGNYASQVIRLYPGENSVELEWLVGPIPVDDFLGKEIITRYETDFDTQEYYYTDANGREILERKRNYRPTWNFFTEEPVSGNYYPINSKIYIKDEAQDSQLTVVTDRSHGGGSIQDGAVELMLNRRLLYDDAFGVGEPLNEPGVDGKGLRVRGKHRLIVSSIANAAKEYRPSGIQASYPPNLYIATLDSTVDEWRAKFITSYSGLTTALPANVNLLTLEPWKDGTVLIRLEHFLESTDDPEELSLPVTVNLQNLFSGFEVVQANETTLGANVWLSDSNRLVWTSELDANIESNSYKGASLADSLDVTLNPMQIKTFVAQIIFN